MVHPELLEILVCPETRLPVRLADGGLIGRINAAIEGGVLKNRAGREVTEPLEEGLVREDEQVIYPVRDDIPVMLIDEAISLEGLS